MPTPIAHLGAGYAIYRYYKHKLPQDHKPFGKFPLQMVIIVGLSMLPDLDIIPAVIFRDMKAYHNNVTHSLLSGVPVALLIAAMFHRTYQSRFWLWFLICLLSYDLHVVMDALTAERGVMMFWPFTQARFTSPVKVFYGLQWGLGWVSIWHLWTIFTESIFSLVLILSVSYFDKRRRRILSRSNQNAEES
jgi:inner membrane protein